MTDDPRQQPLAPGTEPSTGAVPILRQEFDVGSLYVLRAAVAAHASQAGAPERRVSDIVLAVHELAANVVRHGAGRGQVLISAADGVLHCQVTDDGRQPGPAAGTGPGTPGTARKDAHWPSRKGHGLWVVRQISDRLDIQTGPGGSVVTVSFSVDPTGRQRPARPARRTQGQSLPS